MGRSQELEGLNTLPELFDASSAKYAGSEALREFDRAGNRWVSHTYAEVAERVLAWRRAYAALGLKRGERVAMLLPNGTDHVYADLAALANGLIPVPLHAIDTPGASAFIMADSGARILVTNKLQRWTQIRATGTELPELEHVVVTTEAPEADDAASPRIWGAEALLAMGAGYSGELPAGPAPEDLAGIVYTSGTTGRPKGVMLTHANFVANVKDTLECVSPRVGEVFLSFLPLSHTFERMAGYYLALATGCTIAYNRSVLLLAEDLKTIRPQVIISVPRVYERIHARVQEKLKKSSPSARRLFGEAVRVGWADFCEKNGIRPEADAHRWWDGLIRAFLLPRVRETLAQQFGGRLRVAISGGAAVNPKVARTFCGLGLPIIQGYGMTETSPIIAGNNLELNHPDTVGHPFQHVEVRLGEGDEIEVRGPSVMKGYWGRPEDTAAAFTPDGWLKTGDVGEWTPEGMLRIKGRIKEIIVTSTGEKIPPADLESAIETDPLFAQTWVVGENRPYLGLVCVLEKNEWAALCAEEGLDPEDPASLSAARAKSSVLKRAKTAAGDFPHYALPRAVVLTQEPWTIESGLITPTLKLKRRKLAERFAEDVARIYATHG